jgi:hypothetical protein
MDNTKKELLLLRSLVVVGVFHGIDMVKILFSTGD